MKLAHYTLPRDMIGRRSVSEQTLDAWSIQMGDEVFVYTSNANWNRVREQASSRGIDLQELPNQVAKHNLHLVVQKGRLFQLHYPEVPVLLDKGRYLIVEWEPEQAQKVPEREEICFVVEKLEPGMVVFDVLSPTAARMAPLPWIQTLVDGVSQADFEGYLHHLVRYPTRYSSSAHYAAAAEWASTQLQGMGYRVSSHPIPIPEGVTRNVIAEKLGEQSGERDLVIVTAHLDSINSDEGPTAIAPGADDNGSGSAGLLVLARVLSALSTKHDLRMILFGGEEQGLHGSQYYVANLSESDRTRLRAVINMDMIGTLNTPAPAVLLEGSATSQTLIDNLAAAAATYTNLAVQTSLNPYASDHVPFIEAGLPAVLTIEGADSANSNIHTANDTLEFINVTQALAILRMNVATVAQFLGRNEGTMVSPLCGTPSKDWLREQLLLNRELFRELLQTQWSGRYGEDVGGGLIVGARHERKRVGHRYAVLVNPIYQLDEPVYLDEPTATTRASSAFARAQAKLELRIDIDGAYPLHVVSGAIVVGEQTDDQDSEPLTFIGRVTSNVDSSEGKDLIVEEFQIQWPSGEFVNRLEIKLRGSIATSPTAEVVFIATGTDKRYGPYTVKQRSTYFREVQVEVDREEGAVDVEPLDTHVHPDRPSTLLQEQLTLESTFAKAGVRIIRSPNSNVIRSSDAGVERRWSYPELHDSMESHWSAFANRPQWRMWIFLAELADEDGLGGVMFDADIGDPDGVDRQGTALFTKSPHFHTVEGDYIMANPPVAEAVKRELFFNLIHETGHAFNLAHSFQKTLGSPWQAPPWHPLMSEPQALSWMNYPDAASEGFGVPLSAKWFYERFNYTFDDGEHLFLRHAPEHFVQMGNEPWFQNHGRTTRSSLDPRLELIIRSREKVIELGMPVFIEMRLRNISGQPVRVHRNLDPADGFTQLAITNPLGERRPFIPMAHTRSRVVHHQLAHDERLYQSIDLIVGHMGFPFVEPGPYRIEATYTNIDGRTAAAIMQLFVRPPADYDDYPVISELFDTRVGRVLYVGGTQVMEDVNEKIDWVREHLGPQHPAQHYLTVTRALPHSKPFKVLPANSDRIQVIHEDPEYVTRTLEPVLERTEQAADSLGHINFRTTVDTFTRAALDTGRRRVAREAQERMLDLFRKRHVVADVVQSVEERVEELK